MLPDVIYCVSLLVVVVYIVNVGLCDVLYIKKGSTATLKCPYRSEQHLTQWLGPKLTAYSDGPHLSNTLVHYERLRISGNHSRGEYNLEIRNFSEIDEGRYQCNTLNNSLAVHFDYYLEVYKPPTRIKVINQTDDGAVEVNEGQMSILKCEVQSGNPLENITWNLNKTVLNSGGPGELDYEFTPTGSDHNRSYKCIANNGNSENQLEKMIRLHVRTLPVVEIMRFSTDIIFIPETDDLALTCKYFTNQRPVSFIWMANDNVLHSESGYNEPNNTFRISDIRRTNTGIYRCIVSNDVGEGSDDIQVIVTYKPQVARNVSGILFSTEIGHPVNITVFVESFERPSASWTSSAGAKLGLVQVRGVQNSDRLYSLTSTVIANKDDHFGKYGMVVRNRVGSTQLEIEIGYQKKRVLVSPTAPICNTGSSTTINCLLFTQLYSEWTCVWKQFYNNMYIRSFDCSLHNGVSQLVIEFCTYKDAGTYRCEMQTKEKTFGAVSNLSVYGPPVITETSAKRQSNKMLLTTHYISVPKAHQPKWFKRTMEEDHLITTTPNMFVTSISQAVSSLSVYGMNVVAYGWKTELEIINKTVAKYGTFACHIRNSFGAAETSFDVTTVTDDSHCLELSTPDTFNSSTRSLNETSDLFFRKFFIHIITVSSAVVILPVIITMAVRFRTRDAKDKTTTQSGPSVMTTSSTEMSGLRSSGIYDEIPSHTPLQSQNELSPTISNECVNLDYLQPTIADVNRYVELGCKKEKENTHRYNISGQKERQPETVSSEIYSVPGHAYMVMLDNVHPEGGPSAGNVHEEQNAL